MPTLIVLDNTVLTNFALVKQTEVVLRLWPAACTTAATLAEYQVGAASGRLPLGAWSALSIVALTEDEAAFEAGLSHRLGVGERSCLAIAHGRAGVLVSDDGEARSVAQHWGVPLTGTLGILVAAVKRHLLSRQAANAALREMIALGYRSPVENLASLLD